MPEFGDVLREAREAREITLREAERATRISRAYLAALEAEEFTQLPPAAYARGIVRNYAQYLGVDVSAALSRYDALTGKRQDTYEVAPATRPLEVPSHWAPNFAIIAFMLVMSAVVFAWMYSAYFRQPTSLATGAVGIPTVTPVSASILSITLPESTPSTQNEAAATAPATATATATPLPPTPTPTPTEPTTEAAPAPVDTTETSSETNAEVVEEAPAEPVEETVLDDQPTVDETEEVASGAHTFGIWATEEVWVTAYVDGELVLDETLPAGADRIFEGDTFEVSSGNAAYVQVYVDGEEYGVIGDAWDATFAYP